MHIRKQVSIFLPKTCLLFAPYMPLFRIGTSLEPDWNLIGTSLEPRRIITDTSSHNHREIIRIKITNQNLFPFGIFGKPTTLYTLLLLEEFEDRPETRESNNPTYDARNGDAHLSCPCRTEIAVPKHYSRHPRASIFGRRSAPSIRATETRYWSAAQPAHDALHNARKCL